MRKSSALGAKAVGNRPCTGQGMTGPLPQQQLTAARLCSTLRFGTRGHHKAQYNPFGLGGVFFGISGQPGTTCILSFNVREMSFFDSIWFPLAEFSVRKLSYHNLQHYNSLAQQQIPFFSTRTRQVSFCLPPGKCFHRYTNQ